MARINNHHPNYRNCLCGVHAISVLLFIHSLASTSSSVFNSLVPISFSASDYQSGNWSINTNIKTKTNNNNNNNNINNNMIINEGLHDELSNISCPHDCQCELFMSSLLKELLFGVNCSSKSLITIPKNIPQQTEILLLSNNSIEDLHDQIPIIEHLIEIDLSSNGIDQLGRGHVFFNFSHVRVLNLSKNKFRTLFAGVFRGLKRLEHLLMTHGSLKYIDEHAFDGLEMLKELRLDNNQISSVFLELFQSISNLHSLNLSSNSISHLTGGMFASLNTLRKLDLSYNRLITINDNAFVGLDMLEELYLMGNHLWKIPANALQSLKRINHIDIGRNYFSLLTTGDFVQISVQQIHVTNCPNLVLVDRGSFWDLPNLKEIHLNNNPKLEYIDAQSFLSVPSLHLITLHNTSLATFHPDVIFNIASTPTTTYKSHSSSSSDNNDYETTSHHQSPKKIIQITFEANPILCDCNVHYLYQCLHPHQDNSTNNSSAILQIINSDKLKCASPPSLEGTLINDLKINEIPNECPPKLIPQLIPANHKPGGNKSIIIHKKIGDRHQFQCRALGVPTPRIYWILPSGEILNESSNAIHIQLKSQGSLRLFHLKPRDSGTYRCIAENRHGKVTSSVILSVDNIDLHLFPVSVSSTFITLVWNGTARNSFPEYQIVYMKEQQDQENDQTIKDNNKNSKNNNQNDKQLLLKTSPKSQSSTHDNQASSDSNNLSNLNKYMFLNKSNINSVTVNHFLRSFTIHNLEPDIKYKFCIGIRDLDDPHGQTFIQLSCTSVKTHSHAYMLPSKSNQISPLTALLALIGLIIMIIIIILTFLAARKYNKKCQYETPTSNHSFGLINSINNNNNLNDNNNANFIPLENVNINSPLINNDFVNNYHSNK